MQSRQVFYSIIVLVVLIHLLIIVASIRAKKSLPQVIEPPAISGVIIAAPEVEEKIITPVAPPPPEILPKKIAEKKIISTQAVSETRVEDVAIENKKNDPVINPLPTEPSISQTTSNQLVLPQTDATQFNNPAPVYPALSRRAKEEGRVMLELTVLANGKVGAIKIKTSSGYSRLDQAALQAVKYWQFIPARKGDKAIDYDYELPIEFSLKK